MTRLLSKMFTTHHEHFVTKHHKKWRVLFFLFYMYLYFWSLFYKGLACSARENQIVHGWMDGWMHGCWLFSFPFGNILHSYGDTAVSDELRAAKFKSMFGTYCLRKVRDLYRVTHAVTRGLDFLLILLLWHIQSDSIFDFPSSFLSQFDWLCMLWF